MWRYRFRARSVRGRKRRSGWARLLRPKADGGGAIFYSVVSRDSLDAEYAAHRQRFLAEQGYGYVIKDADDLLGPRSSRSSRSDARPERVCVGRSRARRAAYETRRDRAIDVRPDGFRHRQQHHRILQCLQSVAVREAG